MATSRKKRCFDAGKIGFYHSDLAGCQAEKKQKRRERRRAERKQPRLLKSRVSSAMHARRVASFRVRLCIQRWSFSATRPDVLQCTRRSSVFMLHRPSPLRPTAGQATGRSLSARMWGLHASKVFPLMQSCFFWSCAFQAPEMLARIRVRSRNTQPHLTVHAKWELWKQTHTWGISGSYSTIPDHKFIRWCNEYRRMYIYMYIYIYTHMYIHTHIYIYTYIYI